MVVPGQMDVISLMEEYYSCEISLALPIHFTLPVEIAHYGLYLDQGLSRKDDIRLYKPTPTVPNQSSSNQPKHVFCDDKLRVILHVFIKYSFAHEDCIPDEICAQLHHSKSCLLPCASL